MIGNYMKTIQDEENLEIVEITKDPELVNYIKSEIKEKANYIDDLELTRILIQEIALRTQKVSNNEKPNGPSNQLGAWFIKVVDRMLTRGNFRGYSDNYKDEFKSNAYLFFARYWWKFDAKRVAGNYIKGITEGERVLKEESTLKGGFSYFTTLAWTASLGALKVLKEADSSRQKMAEDKFKHSAEDITTEFYIGRSSNVCY